MSNSPCAIHGTIACAASPMISVLPLEEDHFFIGDALVMAHLVGLSIKLMSLITLLNVSQTLACVEVSRV